MVNALLNKFKESIISILPITLIVFILGLTVTPLPIETLIQFAIACVFLIVGMSLFTLGADTAMVPIGQHMGSYLSKKNKPWLMIISCLILGTIVTIAEPDLSILANQISGVNHWLFICVVGVGVGLFLVLGLLRILFKWKFHIVITASYLLIFLFVIFIDQGIIPISFDAGGVTTGPISVPLIMAFGAGLAIVRGSKAKENSFGMIGFASAGPIIAVMILMWALGVNQATTAVVENYTFLEAIPVYLKNVAIIILPIAFFFVIFQIFALKLPKGQIFKIIMGLLYTYLGIVIFLVGVNVGFLPVGKALGTVLATESIEWLIPICGIIGFSMAMVEPAVQVLSKQIGDVTNGLIKRKTMLLCIAVGVSIALILCGIRLITHISILWILGPAYAIVLILSFVAPPLFVGIAFDSGGVATGSMATTFALPLMIGVCTQLGGNVMLEAFGTLAFCAVAPMLVVLIFGVVYKIGIKRVKARDATTETRKSSEIIEYD